jgi:hypothetical protein
VIVVTLTLDGLMNASVAGGIQQAITRTNADGTTDTFGGGASYKSANATAALTGPNASMTASIPQVAGAMGYA